MDPQPSENRGRTKVATISLRDDGVIYMAFHAVDHHGLEDAKEVVRVHNEIAGGVPRPVLTDLTEVNVGADRLAQKYYVGEEASRYKTAMAMLVPSPMQRMLGNIFLLVMRPPYPCRLFTTEKEALLWLANYETKAS